MKKPDFASLFSLIYWAIALFVILVVAKDILHVSDAYELVVIMGIALILSYVSNRK